MATPKEIGAGSTNSHRRAKRVAQGMPAGRAGVSPVRRAGGLAQADDGLKEVFEIPGFVPGTHNLGYCHWIFDEDGTFP